jgi:hypothetical protein
MDAAGASLEVRAGLATAPATQTMVTNSVVQIAKRTCRATRLRTRDGSIRGATGWPDMPPHVAFISREPLCSFVRISMRRLLPLDRSTARVVRVGRIDS